LVCCHGVTRRLTFSGEAGVGRLSWGWLLLWPGSGGVVSSRGLGGGRCGLAWVGSAVAECLEDIGLVLVGGSRGVEVGCEAGVEVVVGEHGV
jgi:hypothetical protein